MSRWRPWKALRERPSIEFGLVDVPPGGPKAIYAQRGGDRAILIDRSLPPVERLAVLAHELVHDERGGSGHQPGMPPAMRAVVGREEARVDAIVAQRLVPLDELAEVVTVMCDLGGGVTAEDVAEHFEVPAPVAARALEQLRDRRLSA